MKYISNFLMMNQKNKPELVQPEPKSPKLIKASSWILNNNFALTKLLLVYF